MIRRYVMLLVIATVLPACGEAPSRVQIPFTVAYGESNIACNTAAEITLTDLRFYVHDIRLIDADGQPHSLVLDDDIWQQPNLALLDLEDGSGSCTNGTTETNTTLRGTVAVADIRGLEFSLGVPFAINHGDPLAATAPLGDAAMHWHWRGGYKFMRAGLRNAKDRFWMHLGSTACQGTIRDITSCDAPNRVIIRLDNFALGDGIVVDLAELIAAGELDDAIPSDCSSGPAEQACGAPFAALGLKHATRDIVGAQRVFGVRETL